jgi:(E)-4-hydroxy-3-methylbut-2-enyl-diphosphate synthase
MQGYAPSLTQYKRLKTREVRIGDLYLGGDHPIRVQTMTTTDTMDTEATVAQVIRCIEAGAELVRITAPSKKEAENLQPIKDMLRAKGFNTPLVADIHFTPNAAEIAARIVEKVRVNPGNYVDKKKFEQLEYTDAEYQEEIDRIREKFTPLVHICKEHGTAMRIGTNHGSLSDRIMSRYGDTAIGMVESAMEFLRIARDEDFHQIVLSMKSSNPQVMVQAYRLLVQHMMQEFGECYPLHLGVTEAGDGEDGRIKSAIGIGTLLEDGIGDTIRVSLTEDPEFEIPVCRDLVARYSDRNKESNQIPPIEKLPYDPTHYKRRFTHTVSNAGGGQVPVVVADLSKHATLQPADLFSIGYHYQEALDKWNIADAAADYIYCSHLPSFALPGTLNVLLDYEVWKQLENSNEALPLYSLQAFMAPDTVVSSEANWVMLDAYSKQGDDEALIQQFYERLASEPNVLICLSSRNKNAVQSMRRRFIEIMEQGLTHPVVILSDSHEESEDAALLHFSVETGGLLLDGFGDGISLGHHYGNSDKKTDSTWLNRVAFGILQATRTRISKTEYISCPSCGRTLFDLQETTARIRAVTHHLKGVKIAIMGCIVNGPGEMADADFGYVGSGVDKITLYKGKEVVKRNLSSAVAVDELIALIKEHGAWVDPATVG